MPREGAAWSIDAMTIDWTNAPAPGLDDFERIAEQAWRSLPEPFRAACGHVVMRVQDFADDDDLDALGIDDPFGLSGLYRGVDLTQQSVTHPNPEPAFVYLYRRAILDEWAERGDETLGDLIVHILVHEIGHHMGLSDEAMHEILDHTP